MDADRAAEAEVSQRGMVLLADPLGLMLVQYRKW